MIDLTEFKTITEFPDYLIDAKGNIYSNKSSRLLSKYPNDRGYYVVSLTSSDKKVYTRKVHLLVLETWIGPRPHGMNGLHSDDVKSNNDLSNLYWGTQSQNLYDSVRNGTHGMASKTHCVAGHPFDKWNTYVHKKTSKRACRVCRAAANERSRFKKQVEAEKALMSA